MSRKHLKARTLDRSFATAGYPYRFMKGTTAHGPTKWHIFDFPAALRWLWKGYSLTQ